VPSRKTALIAVGGLLIVAAIAFPAGNASPPRCQIVPAPTLKEIEATLEGGLSLGFAAAAKSASLENAYYVAARIDGPGLDRKDYVGVWVLTPSLDPGANRRIIAVPRGTDSSKRGGGRNTVAIPTMKDQAAQDAKACVDRGKF
jgi:hypothetical protein